MITKQAMSPQLFHWTVWGMTAPDATEKHFCPIVLAATYEEALQKAQAQNPRYPCFDLVQGSILWAA
jgi:hypothetical protein